MQLQKERLNWHLTGEHRPMYAFFDNGIIVGYYSLLLQENKECELNNLFVIPSHRHNGLGGDFGLPGKGGSCVQMHKLSLSMEK